MMILTDVDDADMDDVCNDMNVDNDMNDDIDDAVNDMCDDVSCREFRSLVIEIVLATDMSYHFQQIKNMRNHLSMPET